MLTLISPPHHFDSTPVQNAGECASTSSGAPPGRVFHNGSSLRSRCALERTSVVAVQPDAQPVGWTRVGTRAPSVGIMDMIGDMQE